MPEPAGKMQKPNRTARKPTVKAQTRDRKAQLSNRTARGPGVKVQKPDETRWVPDAPAQALRKLPALLWSPPGEPTEQPNPPDVHPPAGSELSPRYRHHSGYQT
jgi:hypothetical protein